MNATIYFPLCLPLQCDLQVTVSVTSILLRMPQREGKTTLSAFKQLHWLSATATEQLGEGVAYHYLAQTLDDGLHAPQQLFI